MEILFCEIYFFCFDLSEDEAKDSLVYSYTKIFNAFAAKLSADEAEELSGNKLVY